MADVQDHVILFLILLVSFILARALFTKYRTRVRRPPGPLALPIIGHFHLLGSKPYQSLHKLSLRYGPLFQFYFGSVPSVVVSSGEMAKEFLQNHDISFANRPKLSNIDYLFYGSNDIAFTSYGPYWKFMKKLSMTKLLGVQTLEKFVPVMREERHLFLQTLLGKAEAGEAVDVNKEIMRLTNNLITKMIMRHRCSESEDDATEVKELMTEMMKLIGSFNLSDFVWFCKNLDLQGFKKRVKEARARFDAIMERIMKAREEERRKKGDAGVAMNDFLDILLDIMENEKGEMRLTRENVKGIILDIFGGGTETSGTAATWAVAELINHPNIMEKARQEIDSVVGKDRLVEESDIANLPYLQAIVKETLRLHPPGALIARESTEDCTIGGYHIPAKTQLFVNRWAIGRDPNYWENPLQFLPKRFLREDGSIKSHLDVRGQHFHLLPFGSGRRICPGVSLALQVIQTSLAAMIQCFEWRVGDGGNGNVDMEEGPNAVLAHPLICVPVARFNPFPKYTM
ncbi:hypothetical protein PVL29_010939 [Vitis rotundifolia]|uniref:3,9-dihydroxypterocarpan 6A-monooxygenase n=2 Tax=Vitis rotundifolia TaxID=103349 RepID=A0AA39DU62_VITRO|nr:hypothetical protein PVL29_010939 [Vitis rotundifolia]